MRSISAPRPSCPKTVTITYDGSTRAAGLAIYVDGKPAETEIHNNNYKNITGGGNDHIIIGQRFRDVGFAKGLVDDFRCLTAN